MKKWKIGLDPGHGGTDRFNVGPTGYVEADGTLSIGLHCRQVLKQNGYEVFITRTGDQTLNLAQRARLLNRAKVNLAVSIHTNGADYASVRGTEVIHSVLGWRGKKMAAIVLKRLCHDLELPSRGIYSRKREGNYGSDYYGIIRRTWMPCVIVEVEFHTNPEAEALLKNPKFLKKAGVALAKGIMEYCVLN